MHSDNFILNFPLTHSEFNTDILHQMYMYELGMQLVRAPQNWVSYQKS